MDSKRTLTDNTPQKDTNTEIALIVDLLKKNYSPDYIYCYGIKTATESRGSCFAAPFNDAMNHYFLIVLTAEQLPPTKDAEAEQQIIRKIDCNVTVVSHSSAAVQTAIGKKSRFFITVVNTGRLLYTREGLEALEATEPPDVNVTLAKAERHFNHRMPLARGFFEAAKERFGNGNYELAVFMLHNAAEHCCLALIRVIMGYSTDIRHLGRLLELTFSFSDDPEFCFSRETDDEKRHWRILHNCHSEIRFKHDYSVTEHDAFFIMRNVKRLLEVTERLCGQKIDEYKTATEAYTRHERHLRAEVVTDIRPAIDYILKTIPADKIYRLDHYNTEAKSIRPDWIDLIILITAGTKVSSADLEIMKETITIHDPRIHIRVHVHKDLEVAVKRGALYWIHLLQHENIVFDKGGEQLPLPPADLLPQLRANAVKEFRINFKKAEAFYEGAVNYHAVGNLESAAFMLQQSAELCLRGLIWSVLGQDKRTHSLKSHIDVSRKISPMVSAVFPMNSAEEEKLLHSLESAYLDARYTTNYKMDENDLLVLLARVQRLLQLSNIAFDRYITSPAENTKGNGTIVKPVTEKMELTIVQLT